MKSKEKISKKNYYKAKSLYENNRLNEALNLLNETIKIVPKDLNLYHLRGRVFQDLKKYKNAIKDFNTVLKHFPNDIDVLLDIAYNYYMLGQYNKAIEIYDKILITGNYFIQYEPFRGEYRVF
ncbi:MAG: tetratricopeptide repeat protein [Candidatus Helarchaeota archaeon]